MILNEIGSNREIKDRNLTITPYKWLIPVQKDIKGLEAEFYTLELDKNPLNTKQKEAYTSLCRNLLAYRDSFRTFLIGSYVGSIPTLLEKY
jgi:hypothetical protein